MVLVWQLLHVAIQVLVLQEDMLNALRSRKMISVLSPKVAFDD
jgi:hypothetical protein